MSDSDSANVDSMAARTEAGSEGGMAMDSRGAGSAAALALCARPAGAVRLSRRGASDDGGRRGDLRASRAGEGVCSASGGAARTDARLRAAVWRRGPLGTVVREGERGERGEAGAGGVSLRSMFDQSGGFT
jgi:hypothetical protein